MITSTPLLPNPCCAQYFRFGDLIQPVEFSQRIENQARQFFSRTKSQRFQNFIHEFRKSIHADFIHAVKRKICKSQAQFLILKSVSFS